MPLLTNDPWRLLLAEALERAVTGRECRLVSYVFMPEHVHVLVQPTVSDPRIDLLRKAIKAPFSARVRRRLEADRSPLLARLTVRERPGVERFRFWQEGGGYDLNLRSVAAVESAIDYIHENPVRRGLCARADDWRWSSARHYRGGGSEVPPAIHGLSWDFYD